MAALSADVPEWFERAIAIPGQSHHVEVEGCAIHYLAWGDPGMPGLLLVGASGGHAHWYDHIAPMLCDQFHIVAIDLAGCGDSGRRETYTREYVIAEIAGVLRHSGMLERDIAPVVVGHSAGAQCAVRAAQVHGEDWLGVIAVDGLRYAELEIDGAIAHFRGMDSAAPPPPRRAPKVYDSLEDAAARFRLSPPPRMEIGNEFIVRNIARQSFRQVDNGWITKFDTAQTRVIDLAFELTGALKNLECRAASLYGEFSHLTDQTAGPVVTAMNEGRIASFTIPGTSHYPQIDSPFAFVAAIKGIALAWQAEERRDKR